MAALSRQLSGSTTYRLQFIYGADAFLSLHSICTVFVQFDNYTCVHKHEALKGP